MSESTSKTGRMSRMWRALVALQTALLIFALAVPAGVALAAPSGTGATIASDKADYAPGETVTLTGTGWAAGEAVRIVTNDTIGQTWQRDVTVTADAFGGVTDVFSLPAYFVSNYNVTATGPISGTATTSFTDGNVDIYDQCANGNGSGPTCNWTNGNLNGQNSTYPEGTATLQALSLSGFGPGQTHFVTLNYGTTKAGKHAYDYLTQWDWSESWATLSDRCQGVTGCTTAAENVLGIPNDPNVTDTIELAGPGARNFVMRGAVMNNASIPSLAGLYTGDSDTSITISFTVASSGSMCSTKGNTTTCGIVLWFGAHVSRGDQWTAFNGTTGAGSVSGSPYHVAISALDSLAVGNRDNQMQASAVVATGSLILAKTLTGGPTGYTGPFVIGYDCGTGFTGSATVSSGSSATIGSIPTGTLCTVSETVPTAPTGYSFGTPTFTDTSGTANDGIVTIPAGSGSTVTVTTNNTLHTGHVAVIKTQSGLALSGTQAFTFELRQGAAGPSTPGTLLETQVLNASNSTGVTFVTNLTPGGHYQLCEIVDVGWSTNLPSQFYLTIALVNDRICSDFVAVADGTVTFSVDNTPPPGGGARTIGYWKNHSSCKTSNGNQSPILDQTLALFPIAAGQTTHGFYVGNLYVDTCAEAYALLNKSTLNGKKSASDPAWNFASQYTAYLLNIMAGASPNSTAAAAGVQGQAILVAINFNGISHTAITKTQASTLNTDAGILDSYNNNTLP